jgi:hypothetical protein
MAEICVARGGEPSSHAMVEMHHAHPPSNLGRAENAQVAVFSLPLTRTQSMRTVLVPISVLVVFLPPSATHVELAMGRGMIG